MSITNDIAFSMLSYSKIYEPYVFAWGKRTGHDLVSEKLSLNVQPALKSKNLFEMGVTAGTLNKIVTDKIIMDKIKYSQAHYKILKDKNLKELNGDNLLKIAYPNILLSPGSHTLLYWIGKESGLKLGCKHNHNLTELKSLSNKLKIGNVEIKSNKILLHDSAFAREVGSVGKPVCSYYAGLISGFLTKDKKCNVIETKCIANGDRHCEFVLF
ncbi:MAG: hypothetical protein KJ697_04370 [Nanoarchaeota archaeon]|nr:hypothetical protein [Nanoarchaeota archaeon]MBU4123917.1 hypothetical protein [Nanoarchaeota archaeon]